MKTIIIICMLATSIYAVENRASDYTGLNSQLSSTNNNYGNTPAYQGSSVNSNSGYDATGNYQTNSDQYNDDNAGQQQPSPMQPNSGNFYYYYYPTENGNKLSPQLNQYQAAPSNQQTQSLSPNNGEQNNSDGQHQPGVDQLSSVQSNNQELNYNAQPMSDYQASQPDNSYENQLSSLASALQQYGLVGNQQYNSENLAAHPAMQHMLAVAGSQPMAQVYQQPGTASSFSAEQAQLAGGFNQFTANQPVYDAMFNAQQANPLQYAGYGSVGNLPTYEASPAPSFRSKYGIGSIIMPVLALAGLSLLIPSMGSHSSTSGRTKRSAPGSKSTSGSTSSSLVSYIDRIDRYYSLYKSAVEKEECMNRIICELGDVVGNVRGKATIFNIIEKVAPTWMGNKVDVLKNGALSPEASKCSNYTCY